MKYIDTTQFGTSTIELMRRSTTDSDGLAAADDHQRRRSAISVLFISLCLFVVAATPVLFIKIPPFDDYPNHLARIAIIADHGRNLLLSQFYEVQWRVIPDLAMDLFAPPLASFFGVYWAGKAFVLALLALIMGGVQSVHVALFRRFSPGPSIAVLFLYNVNLSLGFVNYLFGIGVALFGIAAWIALRHRAIMRFFTSLAFIAALFICHLAAVGIYGLGLVSFEVAQAIAGEGWKARAWLQRCTVLLLPFAVIPVLLALSPTGRVGLGLHWQLYSKGQGLWYIVKSYHTAYDLGTMALIVLCGVVAWRRGILRLHQAGWVLLALALPLYLALPESALSATHVDNRMPIGVLFVALALITWDLAGTTRQHAFLGVIIVLALLRIGGAGVAFARMNDTLTNLERSEDLIPPGSKILVASGARTGVYFGMENLFSDAVIAQSSLVSVLFANQAQHVLVVKSPYARMVATEDLNSITIKELLDPPLRASEAHTHIYWRDWQYDYDYLYVAAAETEPNPAPDRLDLLYRCRDFQLYRIDHRSFISP